MKEEMVVMSMDDYADMQVKEPAKKWSERYKEVVEYSLDGVYIRTWECARQAALAHKTNPSTVVSICNMTNNYLYFRKDKVIFMHRGEDIAERLKLINPLVENLSTHAVTGKEVCEYTLGGRLLCKWPTAVMAAKANKTSAQKVGNCCKGKRLFLDKRIFLYAGDDIKQRVKEVKAELYRLSKKRPKYREVDEYSLEGEFIKGYPSASAASKETGIHVSDITRCCNNGDKYNKTRLTTKGRIFLWVGDSISDRLELIKNNKK